MSKSKDSKSTTTSGIQTLESGNRVIPSSTRADGTTRPERRVKPGFTPAEDVVKYHNRTAEAWRNRGSGGVPGATDVVGEGNKAGGAGKKKRRRAKKGGAAGADGEGKGEDEGEEGEEGAEEGGEAATPAAATTTSEPAKAEGEAAVSADVEKKAKGLHKKIRQAQELKSRKEKGETLLPEQLDKALRLGELIRDLEKLGVKYEG
ncbi:hypothetical protein TWF102_009200 [Orbilia oligospora]|uniref:WIBG Mago-binding domain-containing protein n=1 Tax=Orbilia oligospora TaxID=2813651 RepID=A0A7C8JFD7_ORBOL|nr:hypothetical protein TWF103_011866 [Orbilia oligospora]KAF3109934.1 hypothetical protein TWF102_009200 [Orbilia oligospora]KAF3117015.1 hypothetical protein TWF706_000226 [Orbilia oligospora]KAF3133283.1 hypothetical protein TWF594_009235 [Orbilia oligospora]